MNDTKSRSKIIPNSFPVPNFYVDELLHLLDGDEVTILLYALRRILGFEDSRAARQNRISLSQFVEGTKDHEGHLLDHGCGLAKATVIKRLRNLIAWKILIVSDEDSRDYHDGTMYAVNFDDTSINFNALLKRQDDRFESDRKRTQAATIASQARRAEQQPERAKEYVSRTDKTTSDVPTSAAVSERRTYQPLDVRRTNPETSDVPISVRATLENDDALIGIESKLESKLESKPPRGSRAKEESRKKQNKTERPRNLFTDYFEAEFLSRFGISYQRQAGDFVQFAACRKAQGESLTMERWQTACRNYFNSNRGNYTIRDLSACFATFAVSIVDRYNRRPGNGDGLIAANLAAGAIAKQKLFGGEK